VTYSNGQIGTLEQGFTDIPLNPSLVQAAGLDFRGMQLNYKTPYMQMFNFSKIRANGTLFLNPSTGQKVR
jgi:hypothetical protein